MRASVRQNWLPRHLRSELMLSQVQIRRLRAYCIIWRVEDSKAEALLVQEVTPESYEMMRRSPWFDRYMASPFGMQSYDTAILYNKSHVTAAGPFQRQPFSNSRMGRLVTMLAFHWLVICVVQKIARQGRLEGC